MNRDWFNQKLNPALKTKTKITKITNRQNTMRSHDQKSWQLFPKRWPLSNPNRTKSIMNKHKGKRDRNSDTKTGNREPQKNYRLRTVSNELSGGLNKFNGQSLKSKLNYSNVSVIGWGKRQLLFSTINYSYSSCFCSEEFLFITETSPYKSDPRFPPNI